MHQESGYSFICPFANLKLKTLSPEYLLIEWAESSLFRICISQACSLFRSMYIEGNGSAVTHCSNSGSRSHSFNSAPSYSSEIIKTVMLLTCTFIIVNHLKLRAAACGRLLSGTAKFGATPHILLSPWIEQVGRLRFKVYLTKPIHPFFWCPGAKEMRGHIPLIACSAKSTKVLKSGGLAVNTWLPSGEKSSS